MTRAGGAGADLDDAGRAELELIVLRRIREHPAPRSALQRALLKIHGIEFAVSERLIGSLAARIFINSNRRGGKFLLSTMGRERLARIEADAPAVEWSVYVPPRRPALRPGALDYAAVPSYFGPPAPATTARKRWAA